LLNYVGCSLHRRSRQRSQGSQNRPAKRSGGGSAALPDALDRKHPGAPREWKWQWFFPATRTNTGLDPMIYTHVLNRGVRPVKEVSPRGRNPAYEAAPASAVRESAAQLREIMAL